MGGLTDAVAVGGLATKVILWMAAVRLAIVVLRAALELRNEWKTRPR